MKDIASTLFFEAMNLARDRRTDRAAEIFNRLLAADPAHEQARYNLALCLLDAGRVDESLSHFNKLLESRQDDADVLANIGRIHLRRMETDEARAALERALAIDPGNGNALCWMGILRGRSDGDYEAAMELFTRSIALGGIAEAFVGMAVCRHHLNHLSEALESLEKALALAPDRPVILNHMGILCMKLRMEQRAENFYHKALLLDPEARFRHRGLWDV